MRMTTKTDLLALAERVEKCTEGDRVLDKDVWNATSARYPADRVFAGMPPKYTTSLDAALTLVPDGLEYEITNLYGVGSAAVGLNCSEKDGPWDARHEGGNTVLALCAAALRALAQEKD